MSAGDSSQGPEQLLAELPNLGPRSAAMLVAAKITSKSQLQAIGPVLSFLAVKRAGQRPSKNLLWALAALEEGVHWTQLSEQRKAALLDQLDSLTQQ